MEREQFTFYRSFWEALKALPKKDQLPFVMAVCSYAFGEEARPLTGPANASFLLVKPVLDKASKKAESGRTGGSKPKSDKKQTESKQEANGKQAERKPKANGKQTARDIEGEREEEREIEGDTPPISPPGGKRGRFVPPTEDEVRAYCQEHGYMVDPAEFVSWYQANGWRVGKNPMKDWRAAVRTWEQRRRREGKGKKDESSNPFIAKLEEMDEPE